MYRAHEAVFALLIAVTAALSLTLQAQEGMRPGKYEDTREISMPGRAAKAPPRTTLKCVTAEELKDVGTFFKNKGAEGCKVLDRTATATRVTVTSECPNQAGTMTVKTDITFAPPDAYHAVLTMTPSAGGASNPMYQGSIVTVTGHRVGDCTK